MSLSQKIAVALDARLDNGAMPRALAVGDGPHQLTLHLTASSPVGLAFDALEFATTARPEWSSEALLAWGEGLTRRVSYLMEPLAVLENDTIGGTVGLRSHAPTARADRRAYYEVRLGRPGTLRLSRVAFDETTRRRSPASCQMTREVLERLIDDIIASIG